MPREFEKQWRADPDVLTGEDKTLIGEIFEEEIVPRLRELHARVGALSCEFAGDRYKNWVVHFRSAGSGFAIVDLEYDEDAAGIDLDM